MKMKAVVYEKYGPLEDVLVLKEVVKPTPKDNEVLVKIHSTGINFADYGLVRGKPYLGRLWSGLIKPKHPILGADIAGQVEVVGNNVKQFQTGDEVFGDISSVGWGGFAEYVAVPENVLALKPDDISFEEAAAIPQATHVVVQGLRDHGQIKSGQKVLINGASGNNGSLAVQVAKSFGTEVTGVCSTRNLEFVKSLGADNVIDYTQEDFTKSEQQYDLIFDIAVSHSISDYKRSLNPKGTYIAGGFNSTSLFFGPLISMFGSKKVASYMGSPNVEDLEFMKELIETGKVKPAIGKRFKLSEVVEAIQYYKKGAQGKVVINIV